MSDGPQNDLALLFLFFFGLFALWLGAGGAKEKAPEQLINRIAVSSQTETSESKIKPISKTPVAGGDPVVLDSTRSPWEKLVTISAGNARSAYQPHEEYIVINVSSRLTEPVNITGWIIQNGAGLRLYDQGGQIVRGVTKTMRLPSAIGFFTDSGIDRQVPVILEPGQKAIVTTGQPLAIRTEIKNLKTSFRTNLCTGYIDKLSNYRFSPALPQNCPDPKKELGITALSLDCQKFIDSRIRRCHTPEFSENKIINGQRERGNYVDGFDGLSSTCRAYLKKHFSYQGCLAFHGNDPDFYKNSQWRLYLNQNFELWENRDETISLYDSQGRLVHQIKY